LAGGGSLYVTDLRTGTEFNRVLKLPDGKFVVEGGYIDSWGEHEIRIIGRGARR
jgi:hypothetical protein